MENMEPTQTSVDVKLDYIQRDIREIKDALKDNVTRRELTDGLKAVRDEIPNNSDHETRIRSLEGWIYKAIGALVICQVIIVPIVLFLAFQTLKN